MLYELVTKMTKLKLFLVCDINDKYNNNTYRINKKARNMLSKIEEITRDDARMLFSRGDGLFKDRITILEERGIYRWHNKSWITELNHYGLYHTPEVIDNIEGIVKGYAGGSTDVFDKCNTSLLMVFLPSFRGDTGLVIGALD